MRFQYRFALLATLGVIGLASACGAPPPADTPEARQELAQKIARMEAASGALDQTLDLGAALAFDSTRDTLVFELGREVTEEDAARVTAIMRSALAEVLTIEHFEAAVAGVYAEHFTPAELMVVHEFFESAAGAKVLATQGLLTEQIGDATEAILDEHLEAFIGLVDDGLAVEYPELVEDGP